MLVVIDLDEGATSRLELSETCTADRNENSNTANSNEFNRDTERKISMKKFGENKMTSFRGMKRDRQNILQYFVLKLFDTGSTSTVIEHGIS